MNLGFEINPSTIRTLIMIFTVYSLIVVGLGAYVKFASKKDSVNQKLANFLTGGGSLGSIAVAMLIFTSMSSAGSAVGGPGTGYSVGFTWSVCVWTGLVFGAIIPFTVGKKMAIMSKRTGAVSIISLLRHRYGNSKVLAVILAVIFAIFLGAQAVGQFAGGGRVFAVVTGTGNYTLGVLIIAAVTLIYTVTGGIKSISKVAVFQGFLMIITVITMYMAVIMNVTEKYGSVAATMEWLAANNPNLVVAETWDPMYMFGTSLLMCWVAVALPTGLISCFTYNKSSTLIKGGIIALICTTIFQFIMSGLGPFTYSLGQTLTSGDYTTVYTAITVLPDVMAGFIVACVASAIQSTVATLCIIVAGSIVIDVYRNIINPNIDNNKLNRMNTMVTLAFGVICMLVAFKPTDMIQMFINFSSGGLASAIIWPLLFGLYSKKATTAGAIGSTLGGCITYIACYMMSTLEPTKRWWVANMGNVYPVIPGVIASLIIMLICNRVFKPVEKGCLQVWFCKDYDEAWAKIGR